MALLVGTLEIAKSPSFEAGRLGYLVQGVPTAKHPCSWKTTIISLNIYIYICTY